MAMAKALDIKDPSATAEPAAPESYDEKVKRLLAERQKRTGATSPFEVVGAVPGWHYAWVPDDKSAASNAARARLKANGYELATNGEVFAGLPGGEVWRVPTPVHEAIAREKYERSLDYWRRVNVDPASLAPTVVKKGNATEVFYG